jgi:sortase A
VPQAATTVSVTTAPPTTVRATTTTVRPTTTDAPTTTHAVTTTVESTTTTIETTTTTTEPPIPETIATVAPLPQPIAPPPPRVVEEHVELGTIEIPKLEISKKLLEGISLNTLDKAPGHWPGTAMPGHQGNVVVAGHRTSKDRPFRHIDELVPGDEVIFTTAEGRFVYLVTDTQIVAPTAMWIVSQTAASTATLFACHPVGSTAERIVVFLQLQA